MMEGKPLALKTWQSTTLRLLGSAVLLAAIFWFIPFSEVIEALKGVKLAYVAAALAVLLFTAWLDALALLLPLHKVGVPGSQWTVFEVKMITRFYAQFLPSELMASAFKLHRLAAPTRQWGEVTAAMVFTRVVSALVFVLLGLVLWLIEMPTGPGRLVGFLLVGMAVGLLGMHFMIQSVITTRSAKRLFAMRGFAWIKGKFFDKVRSLAQTTVTSYRLFGNTIYPVILLALVRHLMGIITFTFVALSLDLHISLLAIGWIRVVMYALLMLPISIAGIGVREGSFVILLPEYGVAPNDAVALSFLLFVVTLVSTSAGGLLEIKNLLGPRRDRKHAASAAE
jgi:uncharacterized protein (TIRG00374 family)